MGSNGNGQHESKVEASDNCCENLVFNQYIHRKHLSYFYFQDLDGSKVDSEKREFIAKFTSLNIVVRLFWGLFRGIFHFTAVVFLFIPNCLWKLIAACSPKSHQCGSVQPEEGSRYREMEVCTPFRLPPHPN